MTHLAIGTETDALIKAAVRLELVAIIAVELLSIHRRNVGSEMALMIETQHIGIARADAFQLKFGMRFPKRSECRCKPLRRPRQLENDLLRGMWMSVECIARKVHSFFGRRSHHGGGVVAGGALGGRAPTKNNKTPAFPVSTPTGGGFKTRSLLENRPFPC